MTVVAGKIVSARQPEDRADMGTIIEFPAEAALRRSGSPIGIVAREGMGTILILPVIRIERDPDASSDGRGPEEGAAQGRRRRRR
jgi:hypothetical protein